MLNVESLREDFPILHESINGNPLIYLDNAATTQVPRHVMDAWVQHYRHNNANIHRGIHTLSERSSENMEAARKTVAEFIHCGDEECVVFTYGTTDSINLVAAGLGHTLSPGDEVLISELEHHSNILPWQQICEQTGAVLQVAASAQGDINAEDFRKMIGPKTKIIAVAHVSNVTGAVLPVKQIAAYGHCVGALVLIDGAQAIRSEVVDVEEIDCDFYCFSGHKALAPSGIGILYGKAESLRKLKPFRLGGGMVHEVETRQSTFIDLPLRLEGGTPNYSGGICLGEALRYINAVGKREISQYERELILYTEGKLREINGIEIIGNPAKRSGVVSFFVPGVHSFDIAVALDCAGIAVRSGTHCAQLLHRRFRIDNSVRISPAFYNTYSEVDTACHALNNALKLLNGYGK